MIRKRFRWIAVLIAVVLTACGGGDSGGRTGTVTMALTDAPGSSYDNVFITVRSVWFHRLDTAPYDNLATSDWVRIALPASRTVDLLSLRNGRISRDILNDALPEGIYRQILVFLEPTEAPVAPEAAALGLRHNNEVVIGGNRYPLRIPNARQGIRLLGTFSVEEGKTLRLVVDFDAGHDIVEVGRGFATDYILKPRLTYFDLAAAGAVVGTIDAVSAADNSALFVVKAESPNGMDNAYHVIRRATVIDDTGRFVLYPLNVPPGGAGTTYDVVIRGEGYNTVIVKNVPVVRGTRPGGTGAAAPTAMPPIDMSIRAAATPDYNPSVSVSPTGTWVQFYQTLDSAVTGLTEIPYVIRIRHAHPFTGRIDRFPLSSEDVWWGIYDNVSIGLAKTAPVEGTGVFKAAADAPLYDRSGYAAIAPGDPVADFALVIGGPASPRRVSAGLTVPVLGLDNGVIFAVHGGMIVDAKIIAGQVGPGTRRLLPDPIFTLPGGSPAVPFPFAFYGIEAFAWAAGSDAFAVGLPALADLRMIDDAVDIAMIAVIPPAP